MMLRRSLFLGISAMLMAAAAAPLAAQEPAAGAGGAAGGVPADLATGGAAGTYTAGQLDALLAPLALYPDELLAQALMASTFPLQVIDAFRWVEDPSNKALQGDALVAALKDKDWDPSVKSLVPFPQVLAMMNSKLDWTEDLGFAMTQQEKDVWDSVQRLRHQAQAAGNLKSTEQQVVETENQSILIAPAQPNVVYVPTYNPASVYGAWPYPAYPPVYVPYPPGYALGAAVVAGVAFGVAVGINRGLWGWATPHWGHGNVNLNINRYNNINVSRRPINNPNWRPGGPGSSYRPGAGRPPRGQVGAPGRPGGGLRPAHQPAHRPGNQPGRRPGHQPAHQPAGGGGRERPAGGGLGGGARASQQPAGGGAQARQRPAGGGHGGGARASQRPAGGGFGGGARASQRPQGTRSGGGRSGGMRSGGGRGRRG
jgi:Protein of unknown function (DUF3300)